jgi:ribonuclease HI
MEKVEKTNFSSHLIMYTDGACSGNPGPGGWGSLIFYENLIYEIGGFESVTTNNRMEILSVLKVLEWAQSRSWTPHTIEIYSDSKYLIQSATLWYKGWMRRGWVTSSGEPVKNRDLFESLIKTIDFFKKENKSKVQWTYVPGHKGFAGNERVDAIAVSYSRGYNLNPPLYEGLSTEYYFDFLKETEPLRLNHCESKKESFVSKKELVSPKPSVDLESYPYPISQVSSKSVESTDLSSWDDFFVLLKGKISRGYLAYVNNHVYMLGSWTECERLVKGRRGARYQKFFSTREVVDILEKWSVSPKHIEGIRDAL